MASNNLGRAPINPGRTSRRRAKEEVRFKGAFGMRPGSLSPAVGSAALAPLLYRIRRCPVDEQTIWQAGRTESLKEDP